MKIDNDKFDKVLNKLISSAHSPRGKYSAEKSWKLLEARLQKRRTLRRLWLRTASSAAIVVLCMASWAAYYALMPSASNPTPNVIEKSVTTKSLRPDTLIFNQQPLEEIVHQLSLTFHTEIRIEGDSLKNYRMTATFQSGEDLMQILDLLKHAAGNFTYTKTNETIIISNLSFGSKLP